MPQPCKLKGLRFSIPGIILWFHATQETADVFPLTDSFDSGLVVVRAAVSREFRSRDLQGAACRLSRTRHVEFSTELAERELCRVRHSGDGETELRRLLYRG